MSKRDGSRSEKAVRIPKDPAARARLAEMAGLTEEERHAIDQWCYDQQREQDKRMGRDGIHE